MVEPPPNSEGAGIMEFNCHECGRRLSIPSTHHGRVRCPECGIIQRTSLTSGFNWRVIIDNARMRVNKFRDTMQTSEVTRNQASIGFTIGGMLLGMITVAVFLNGFTGTWCEEWQSVTYIDENGQEAVGQTCADNQLLFQKEGFQKLISSIGLSCFVLLPISVFILLFGLALRDDSPKVSVDTRTTFIPKPSISDSSSIRTIQTTIAGLGIGVMVMTIIVVVILLILFIVLIGSIISNPPAGYGG